MVSSASPGHQRSESTAAVGPHASYIQIAKPYVFEEELQECRSLTGVTEAKEDLIRLQGVQWIDNTRRALRLPVRTFNTAVVYYHKFRLAHAENEYGFLDAAAAALFTACKIEDTLKRSKEILCAAYNLKLSSAEQLTQDDPMFEDHSKRIVGLERLMLESSAFDYRSRYPQRLLLKVAKYYQVDKDTVGRTAYSMSLDLYRTFAPLKQTTSTMAIACVELAGRLHGHNVEDLEAGKGFRQWRTSRAEVMETLLDLLDLYTHHRTHTTIGQEHALETFISIRITLNQESTSNNYPRHTNSTDKSSKLHTNGTKLSNGSREPKLKNSPISPRDPHQSDGRLQAENNGATPIPAGRSRAGLRDGTVRFMLDGEKAIEERKIVDEFFKVEEEEIEIEVDRETDKEREKDRDRDRGGDREREKIRR